MLANHVAPFVCCAFAKFQHPSVVALVYVLPPRDSSGRKKYRSHFAIDTEPVFRSMLVFCILLLISQGSLLLLLGPLIGMPFLSTPMVAAHTYVSSRRVQRVNVVLDNIPFG